MAIESGSGTVRGFPVSFVTGPQNRLAAGIFVLILLRFALGAVMPLAFDEAYYWLWSKHLAASYFDHPPAIAYAIRAGTSIFGDTPFGVRVVALLGSCIASWAVWRSAAILLDDDRSAALACLYFNLTLMVAAQSMAATPDALALAASALVLFSLAKLIASDDGRWWIAVGASGGLCLLSKYTGVFLGAGVFVWLFATVQGRRWIATLWPYAGGLLAVAMFAPVILWNASHEWISFRFQFGRVATGGLTARYFGEFLLAQAALASPFILILGGAGFARASRLGASAKPVALAAALMWPALIYFLVHATHDRVQGNWPSFVFPGFAILASFAARETWNGRIAAPLVSVSRSLAIPVAALMLVLVYAEAFFGIVPQRDPIARLTAVGFVPVADAVARLAREEHAPAIVTTSYATTSWLAFYLGRKIPVLQLDEEYRWLSAPPADPGLVKSPLLYVTLEQKSPLVDLAGRFTSVTRIARLARMRRGATVDRYDVYLVSGWRGTFDARVP